MSTDQNHVPQPIHGDDGAPIMGPRNVPLERENPDMVAAPRTNSGTVPNTIAAFAAGISAATRIIRAVKGSGLWPRGVTVALGVAVVLEAAFLAIWVATSGRPGTGSGDVLTAVMALAMGAQSGAILTLNVKGVFTTAATATVMFLMRDVAARSGSAGAEPARLAGVLVALAAGAAAGGLLLVHARTYAPVLPLVATALVVGIALTPLAGRAPASPR